MNIRPRLLLFFCWIVITAGAAEKPIDRKALVTRNNPVVTTVDTLASLSVGNGGFAFTTDITGLQTFPEYYRNGVPLGTQSEWGWHSFDNPEQYRIEESYQLYDFGHGHRELYATQPKTGRAKDAANWYRSNPHRLHLGCIGLEVEGLQPSDIKKARQTLDMWTGSIDSRFMIHGSWFSVQTVCHPERDMISGQVTIKSKNAQPSINLRFPYPTGAHADDACNWLANDKHQTELVSQTVNSAILKRTIDQTVYYVALSWEGKAQLKEKSKNYWVLTADGNQLTYSCEFVESEELKGKHETFAAVAEYSANYWRDFWTKGAAVDFSQCKDKRAKELERRVVLSQYLLAIQCAASTPPQETGLTYNSWFGKFHMEMIWWHQAWLPLWGHGNLLDRTLRWYGTVEPIAREIAMRQGFKGIRWMKMTDRSGEEAPSKVGSFLIWQQPHLIYLAELLYRSLPSDASKEREELLDRYGRLIDETAVFMADFATYDKAADRYILKGIIPAQETLKAAETYNSPFELSYWHFALQVAQLWRERHGLERIHLWDDIIDKLSPLAKDSENRYLAAESAPDTYQTLALISDHPAVLGAVGIFPMSRLIDPEVMKHTQEWIWDNWNWDHTWGWDYPMVAMNAARLGVPENAVSALLMDKRTNTYLPNGHNYQDQRLRCYLPGNGGLLTAIAMMCAGWDGCKEKNPGFPKNGKWNVRWEGLKPLPGNYPKVTAFPGAEGFGRYTTGGRGGKVYHVTTLEDDNQPGTLRWANEQKGPKTIVFDVSGTIFLKSPLRISPNTTIAGQTAPGDGICIADYPVLVGSNNIIRYVRFRLGNREVAHHEGDGLGSGKGRNIIVDHCSVSWSIDECLSVYGCNDFTIQWCIVSQSLNNAGHKKGAHGYGGNWGGSGASYHHNLLAHHTSRTPRLGPSPQTQTDERMDMRNNVIYNWAANGCYGGEGMTVNIVNNYYKPGPGTPTDKRGQRITAPNIRTSKYTHHDSQRPNVWDKMWHVWGKYYVDGNVNSKYPEVTQDNWTHGVYNQIDASANDGTYTAATKDSIRLRQPMPFAPVTTHTAEQAYELVLAHAGASLHRDALDDIIVRDVREGKATFTGKDCPPGIINSQEDVILGKSHWPELKSAPAPKDSDGDGMPDEWERQHGLNPNDATDGNQTATDGYTNLEHYLNGIITK